MHINKYLGICFSLCSLLTLSACSDSGSSNKTKKVTTESYELTFSNLTSNQPMSPLAIALHGDGYNAWSIGEAASLGLEILAESGSGTSFLNEASTAGVYSTTTGAGLILPGQEEVVELEVTNADDLMLTVATMMVNTNDAFVGNQKLDISNLEIGEQRAVLVPVYDAGTEGNSESTGTIPGPADNGEGYNAMRDDFNVVARHPGVVSNQDGYAESILDSSHRFDSPAAKLVLRRIQ